jgi:hypothetical protein
MEPEKSSQPEACSQRRSRASTASAMASQPKSMKPSRLFSRLKLAVSTPTAPRETPSPVKLGNGAPSSPLILRLLKGCIQQLQPSTLTVPRLAHDKSTKSSIERRTSLEGMAPKWLFGGSKDTPPSSANINALDPYTDGPCGLGPLSPVPSTRLASDATDSTIFPLGNGLFGEESVSPLRVLSTVPSVETPEGHNSLAGHHQSSATSGVRTVSCS